MKLHQVRILADENISPKVVAFLRSQGIDVVDTKERGWQGKSDEELLETAYQENRWVLTHDSDFGSLAIHEDKPYWGVVFLRPRDLKPDNVVRVCNRLLQQDVDVSQPTMVVVEEARIRIRQTGDRRSG